MPEPTSTAAGVATIAMGAASTSAITAFGVSLGLRVDILIAGFFGSLVAIILLNTVPGTSDTWVELLRTTVRRMFVAFASSLTAGNGVIGGSLKSSNYVADSSGWILRPDGVAEFSGVTVRGTVYASSGAVGGVNISGGGLNAGGYTGYAWPASGQNGFHLGPGGLAMGNPDNGKYFNVTAAGNVFAPGLSIVDGAATFSGSLSAATGTFSGQLTAQAVDAVNTLNIAGDAVTVPAGATAAMGQVAAVVVRMTSPGRVMVIGNASWLAENNSASSAWVRVVCAGQVGAKTSVSLAPGYSGSATAMGLFNVGVGDHYCYVEVGNTGQRAPGPQGITVIGVKR